MNGNIAKILVISKNQEILATIIRLIGKKPNWHADGTADVQTALLKAESGDYDLLLLGSGLTEHEEQQLFLRCNQSTRYVKHYGGGSGLLYTEIELALSN